MKYAHESDIWQNDNLKHFADLEKRFESYHLNNLLSLGNKYRKSRETQKIPRFVLQSNNCTFFDGIRTANTKTGYADKDSRTVAPIPPQGFSIMLSLSIIGMTERGNIMLSM